MKFLLITGGEQGIGKAIVDKIKAGYVMNITGKDIKVATYANNLKSLIDMRVAGFAKDLLDIGYRPEEDDIYVVNNFGINHLSWIGETEEADKDIMEINVMAPYWVVNALVKHNVVCKIVNVSSQTYRVAQRTTSLYCASKAALNHMTKVMARELAGRGYVVNNFAPGKVLGTKMTEMTDKQVNSMRGWTQEQADGYATGLIPIGRFMTLEESAKIVKHMLVDMPDYINGTTYEAFGGV